MHGSQVQDIVAIKKFKLTDNNNKKKSIKFTHIALNSIV
jgi:hypothetical protein